MKLSMIADDQLQPTEDMVRNFDKRTKEHIDRVANNLHKLHETTDWGIDLLERAKIHDDSKYGEIEREPYIWLTEYHRCKNDGIPFEYPPGIEEKVNEATLHHITSNPHHPEFYSSPADMSDADIVEMVCDWTAMAQELGEAGGSAKGWADKNVGTKWAFTDQQVDLIYTTVQQLDKNHWHLHEAGRGPIIRSVTWKPAILTVQFPSGDTWEYMVHEDRWVMDLMRRHKRNAGRLIAAVKNLPGVIATKKTPVNI